MGILQAIWYWWVKQAEALKAFSALFAIVGAITGAILLFFPSWRNQRVIALLVIAVVGGMIVLSPGEARSRIRTWLRSNCRWMALGVLAALTLALAFIAGRAHRNAHQHYINVNADPFTLANIAANTDPLCESRPEWFQS